MTRALIVGITGFVGPYLAELLRDEGVECIGLSREPLPIAHLEFLDGVRNHSVDVRDRSAVRAVLLAERPDWVFYLAAISHVPTSFAKPDLTFDVNVGGLFSVLDALRQLDNKPRFLFVSSGSVYGQIDSGDAGFNESLLFTLLRRMQRANSLASSLSAPMPRITDSGRSLRVPSITPGLDRNPRLPVRISLKVSPKEWSPGARSFFAPAFSTRCATSATSAMS